MPEEGSLTAKGSNGYGKLNSAESLKNHRQGQSLFTKGLIKSFQLA
jgi:hypothetical protein